MSTTHGLSKADQALIDLVRDRLRGNTALHEATKRLLQENELSLDTPESSHLSLLENARQDRRYSQNNVVASGSSVSKHASSDIEVSSPTPTGFLNLPLEFRQMVYGYFGVCCTLVKQSFLIANCVRSGKNVAFMPICHQFVVDDIGTCVRSNSSISKTVDLPTVSALLATCRTTHADLDAALPNSPLMSIRVPTPPLPRDMERLGLCAGGLPVSRFDCFSISFVDTLIRQSCYFELLNNINHILWYLSQSECDAYREDPHLPPSHRRESQETQGCRIQLCAQVHSARGRPARM